MPVFIKFKHFKNAEKSYKVQCIRPIAAKSPQPEERRRGLAAKSGTKVEICTLAGVQMSFSLI